MGEFVRGLLGESSVNKMAEAMQAAPRTHPRDMIDQPTRSEAPPPQQEAMPPEQMPEQAPQQPPLSAQGSAPPKQDGTVLAQESGPTAPTDNSSGAALPPPSADEEKQARIFMANITDFMYGDGLDSVTQSLKSAGAVPEAIGEITADMVTSQMDAAEAAEHPISENIVVALGAEVVSQLYELAAALGLWTPDSEDQSNQDMSLSLNYAANLFVDRQLQTGRKDRLTGLTAGMEGIQRGDYDSQPGSPMTDNAAPVSPEGGVL